MKKIPHFHTSLLYLSAFRKQMTTFYNIFLVVLVSLFTLWCPGSLSGCLGYTYLSSNNWGGEDGVGGGEDVGVGVGGDQGGVAGVVDPG